MQKKWLNRAAWSLGMVSALFVAWTVVVLVAHAMLPRQNTAQTHFDVIIVLGTPSRLDGTPSPEQRERVMEGVREWKAGVAPQLIMTGGAAHNQWTEAHSMAVLAEQNGVPANALIEEGQAQNTVQNIFYANQIMQQHGWRSAEVVSAKSHLARAGMILSHYPLAWRTTGSEAPKEYGIWREALFEWNEAQYCWTLRWMGFPKSKFMPQ